MTPGSGPAASRRALIYAWSALMTGMATPLFFPHSLGK